ncbi:YwqJ-related putative deaminase [Vibrio rhizosphaerae]|uniref:YwqJ-related putative deaminase n=1 Tax=Vibrio rhizosphaerae TaxID=398736 RepID=A0ABU4ISN9_9VIBR|nr:YwqJ-related putative deaminase [Vibrio rhizosphaerae]MDW6092432.1 YwqJ-related putative deaminase [Vibrio rhizosphaerae]
MHAREVKAIKSLSDELAQKTGMASDKAEKLLAQVAAGRVDKKWSEVYPLDDASIADDVAAANELLDGFAQKQGKELFKDDDVVVNWFSEDPESDVYKDTSLFSENLTSGVQVNHSSGYPQSSAASPVARNPEYLAFYKQNLELAVTNTYQGKLTPEQLSAMKAGAAQSFDDMVEMVKQVPEVAQFAASHPVLFAKAVAKAYTQTLTDNQRDTGEMLALRMMGKHEEAQQVGAKHVGEMLTNVALGLTGEAAAAKAVEAAGKVAKMGKSSLSVIDSKPVPKSLGGNGSSDIDRSLPLAETPQHELTSTVVNDAAKILNSGLSKGDLKRKAALSRASVDELGIVSKEYTNLPGKVNEFPGVSQVDNQHFVIEDKQTFISAVSKLYKRSGNPLNEVTQAKIMEHIGDGKVFDTRAGIPGLHAEVQSVNNIINQLPEGFDLSKIKVSTVKLAPGNGQSEAFPACSNCSGILSNQVDILTGVK